MYATRRWLTEDGLEMFNNPFTLWVSYCLPDLSTTGIHEMVTSNAATLGANKAVKNMNLVYEASGDWFHATIIASGRQPYWYSVPIIQLPAFNGDFLCLEVLNKDMCGITEIVEHPGTPFKICTSLGATSYRDSHLRTPLGAEFHLTCRPPRCILRQELAPRLLQWSHRYAACTPHFSACYKQSDIVKTRKRRAQQGVKLRGKYGPPSAPGTR